MSGVGKAIGKVVGGITGASAAADGASAAAKTQAAAAQAGIDEQRRQFDALRVAQQPFVNAGVNALGQQSALTGLNGADAQQAAIAALQGSPGFTSALQQGENSILQNASATGGLRGGNVQAALGQFSPALLASFINDQYTRLGGLTSLGQSAAAGVGNAGIATGNNVAQLLQQQGAARAGGQLAQGNVARTAFGDLLGIGSAFAGAGGVPGIKKLF